MHEQLKWNTLIAKSTAALERERTRHMSGVGALGSRAGRGRRWRGGDVTRAGDDDDDDDGDDDAAAAAAGSGGAVDASAAGDDGVNASESRNCRANVGALALAAAIFASNFVNFCIN